MSKTDDVEFLEHIADRIQHQLLLTAQPYMFIFANSSPSAGIIPTPTSPNFTTTPTPTSPTRSYSRVQTHSRTHSQSSPSRTSSGSLPIVPAHDDTTTGISLGPEDITQTTQPGISISRTLSTPGATTLLICTSSPEYTTRATLLTNSKFLNRLYRSFDHPDTNRWYASIFDLGALQWDETALWDVLRKSARAPIDPLLPPPGSRGIKEIVEEARAKLQRVTPAQAYDELVESQVGAPTFLVDIRSKEERERYGGVQGALVVERNELEWRFDPRCEERLGIVDRYDLRVMIFCQEGYASSLAAYSLQQIGMLNATDIIGGFEAWKETGLPTTKPASESFTRSPASLAGDMV